MRIVREASSSRTDPRRVVVFRGVCSGGGFGWWVLFSVALRATPEHPLKELDDAEGRSSSEGQPLKVRSSSGLNTITRSPSGPWPAKHSCLMSTSIRSVLAAWIPPPPLTR